MKNKATQKRCPSYAFVVLGYQINFWMWDQK